MHFKSLELYGFKSFAGRTRIDFGPGVTAIVGPNGCGKCLKYDSLVTLSDGTNIKIGDLVEGALKKARHIEKLDDGVMVSENMDNTNIFSINPETLKIESRPVYAFIKRKAPEYLLEIKTKSGKTITTTHYHPFFTVNDGQIIDLKAKQLQIGTMVAIPRTLKAAKNSLIINLFEIFKKFKIEDNAYVPYSPELLNFLTSIKANYDYDGYVQMGNALGISHVAIKSALSEQAMNAANFVTILENAGGSNIPEFVNSLKSKGSGEITLPRQITAQIARFLGYLISEGRTTKEDQIWFVNEDEKIVEDFILCARQGFGVGAKAFSYKKCAKDVLIFSHALCQFLEKAFNFGIGGYSKDKVVPPQIFNCDENIITEFLSSLFEGDAYLCARGSGSYFEYATASKRLAEGVSNLLLRLGIVAMIREKKKCATNSRDKLKRTYYSVYVYGVNNVKYLAGRLRFVGAKSSKLEDMACRHYKSNPNLDLIPEINALIRKLAKLSGVKIKRLKKISPRLVSYYANRCMPSPQGLREALSIISEHGKLNGLAKNIYDYLKVFANSDIYWDEIVGIKKVYSEKWVYDLSILDTHNFVAQDIIVHNSNCVDALKWVLGEQSAKDLRGANMEDVIFNGTDTKDPVGFAEVSLIMSNESKFLPIEYEEVTITRRLFRSGDSEYLLNKNNVRLKDILELFMGTGVGTSAYSIIEQGKIDMIISSKPEDRRYIFEEASGIIKYKSKKREAVRKLEYTENNILRVTDIIEEVKRQINSIERQARKAERYREEFERLKTLDTKASFLEYKRLLSDKEGASGSLSDMKMNESALLKEVSAISSRVGELRLKETEIDTKLSEAQYQELNLNSTIERSRDKIALDQERHRELEELKRSLLNEQASAKKTIAELKEKLSYLTNEVQCVTQNRSEKEAQLNSRKARLKRLEDEYRQNEQGIKTGKMRIVDILSLQSKTRNDLAKVTSDLANLQARERRLKIEEQEVNRELAAAQEAFNAVDKEASELGARIEANKKAHGELEAELDAKERLLEELEKSIEVLKSAQMRLESKLSVLQDMAKRYEGFGQGAKALLVASRENRQDVTGLNTRAIYGALAELITVQKGYEAAAEAVLGELLQAIVVEDKRTATQLITHLKSNNLGRATIICLDSIPAHPPTESCPVLEERAAGRLSDFVEADAKFKGLVSVLFSDAYLVRDLEGLLHIGAGHADLVTMGGDLFRNGFFAGGAEQEDQSAGLLNRRIQIREIEAELEKIKNELFLLDERKRGLTDEGHALFEKINSQAGIIRQDELALANKNSQRESAAASLNKIKEELSIATLELGEVVEDIASGQKRLAAAQSDLKRLDEEHNAAQGAVSTAQSFVEKAIKEKEILLVDITKIETELSNVSEQEKNYVSNLNMQQGLFDGQSALLSEKEKAFNEASRRQGELADEINMLNASIEENGRAKEAASLRYQEVRNQKFELDNILKEAEKEHKEKEKELNAIKDKLHHIEMANQETSFKLETLKTRVSQAYKVELEGLNIEVETDFSVEAAAAEIAQLREKIERMGPVNLVAIEEHQELKERFDFLTKQKDDLINAKESLLEAIRKINRTTRELFMDTFQKVREEFKEYFKYLFGGGQAEIVLMDDQDVLECGIEIMARPPGKKLQSISLLSGGEKALTAIALLFSIFKVKPSPFCILDEVDAPLDESNIGRFTKMLSEFTKTSQFIVITHNKKTIATADVMYGITMQQSGVSKVVSVKFAKGAQKAPVAITEGS